MRNVFFNWGTGIFVVLVAATVVSYWLSGGASGLSAQSAGEVILAVSFLKAALIIAFFMEVLHAPWLVRLIALAWCLLVCVAILALYPFALFIS